jgi:dTDP-4-amino-4,6-dideoxygalactose transaminase
MDDVKSHLSASTAAILAVHQTYAPCAVDDLAELSQAHGVPVVYDSVHALACTYADGKPTGTAGRAEVFSLHATKILNGFEGGYIVTDDSELAAELRSIRNFGFVSEAAVSPVVGFNAKLNEIHAALALASLPDVETLVAGNRKRFETYVEAFAGIPGVSFVPYDGGYEQSNFEFAIMQLDEEWPLGRDETVALMRGENALGRPYYNEYLHRYADYPSAGSQTRPNLPEGVDMPFMANTDTLARRFIQMPVGERVGMADIVQLGDLFRLFHQGAGEIASRLRTGAGPVW